MFLGVLPSNSLKRPWNYSGENKEQKRRACLREVDIETEVQRQIDQELCKIGFVYKFIS